MSPVQAPSKPEARRLWTGLRALARRFSLSEREDASCCGITRSQAATLTAILGAGGVRLGNLGKRLGIRPSTLTRNLARLEEQGLVRRLADARDGRACCAELTEAGRRTARQARRRDEAFALDILERLPPGKRKRTLDALDELLLAVRDATETCCPGAFEHLMEEFPKRRTE